MQLIKNQTQSATQYKIKHRVSALITGKLTNKPENNKIKYLTQIVCFNHFPIKY